MSDSSPRHPTSRPDSYDQPEPRRRTRNVPALVWIVVALLVAWLVIALMQRGGFDRSPHGNTAPREAEGTAIVPAAPANGGAPATPAGTVNGPNQPPGDNSAPR